MRIEVPGGEVSALLDGSPEAATACLILAPGAGAGKEHPFMAAVAEGLAARGILTFRFDFLYAEAGRKAPDRQPVLEATYRAVAAHVRAEHSGLPLFLGGKSMGGRIASHIASGEEGVATDGLVFLGYPLHPPGRPERLRDAHLSAVSAPMLFVEGTRDPFCPLGTLEASLAKVHAPTAVHVIEDGDHSFKVRKSSGRSSAAALDEVIEVVSAWVLARAGRT